MAAARDLTGMQFGLLKAVERTDRREDRYFVWRCECQCGGEAYVSTKRLLRGTVKDCGCVPKVTARCGSIAEDLTGCHFGEWEVLKRAENRKDRVMWECRCSCGTEKTISAHDLKAGKTHSCRNPIHRNLYNRRDLTGKTLGMLKVLSAIDQRNYKGSIIWLCQCLKCGRIKEFSEDALMNNYKSCGCEQYTFGRGLNEYRHFYLGTCVETLGRKIRTDNTSGVTGVYKKANGKYVCGIGFQGKKYHLGTYETMENAVLVRSKAEEDLHGSFIKAYTAWEKKKQEGDGAEELLFHVDFVKGEFIIKSNYLPEKAEYKEKHKKIRTYKSIQFICDKQENSNQYTTV